MLKSVFAKLKISDEFVICNITIVVIPWNHIQKNEVVKDVLGWFQYGIDFMNYGNQVSFQ